MNKLLISTGVLAALGLSGCGGDKLEEIITKATPQTPFSRVVFDPANGNLNIPNDLLMLPGADGFFDYTLNIPVVDPTNFGDPQNALNILDGWSTNQPFVINVETPSNTSLNADTLGAGVHLYEATLGLNQQDADCAAIPIPSAGCKVGDKLTFGVDYVLGLADSNTITVVPLKPLKAAQGYLLVMTEDLKDSSGKPVKGSSTWDLVAQDIETKPLATESQLNLQTLINLHLSSLENAGVQTDNVTYVSAFTTQSVTNVLDTVKQLMIAEFAGRAAAGDPTAGQALPAIVTKDVESGTNSMEALGLVSAQLVAGAVQQGIAALPPEAEGLITVINAADFTSFTTCSGLLVSAGGGFGSETAEVNVFAAGVSVGILGQVGQFCAASRFEGSISLPYYSAIPTAENPLAPINSFWTSACDSGIVLANAGAVLATATPGPNAALCNQVGLADVRIDGELLDRDRNLTKFSPVPQLNGSNLGFETLDVQVTVPNPQVATALGFTLEKPEDGWPVVILAHGITSQKEDMLAVTGALSLAGFATFAIDQPIHGSRGFDLNDDGVDELNATTVSATHYLNLAVLPAGRDNLRQSVSDLLGLRLGLNAVVDTTASQSVDIDTSKVSVFGVSLGAMTGGNFASLANTGFVGPLSAFDSMFAIQAASLESPGGGTANFLLESAAFGPLIKGLLLSQGSPDFQAFLISTFGTVDVSEAQLVGAVSGFLAALSSEQLAGANALFNQFSFAAQTMIDSADPINYFTALADNTPVHMMTVIGDGGDNLPDQVIPVTTALPLAGQQALADIMDLEQISSTTISTSPVSGIVKFVEGAHASSLSPASSPAVTGEMQRQVANYFGSSATAIVVTNEAVVAN
ncbi:MAG: Pla-1/cef family extracellular lipase [Glaciecola sp.]|jgi:Pla-1/cef family extracellular lipase